MSFRHAWAFLTRLPGGAHPADERALGMSVPWFPVVGAVIGLMIGMVWLGLNELVSPLTSATIAVMVGVMITGAFHEDGLADTADSLGGYTPERRLEIMKDSRVGTFGVLALVFSVLVRVFALAALDPVEGVVALVMAHAVGRSIATIVMTSSPAASSTSLGQSYTAHLPKPAVWAISTVIAGCSVVGGPAGVVGYGLALVGALLVVGLARRAYGGTTGDVLGAIEEAGFEVAALRSRARVARAELCAPRRAASRAEAEGPPRARAPPRRAKHALSRRSRAPSCSCSTSRRRPSSSTCTRYTSYTTTTTTTTTTAATCRSTATTTD